jgi:hypothetical protein
MRTSKLLLGSVGLALAACGGGGNDTPDAGPVARATWYQDVGPIVAEHCMGCHQEGGIAPFSLTTYADAFELADRMFDAVEIGLMPPWDAEEASDCAPPRSWKDDPRLSAEELETLRVWIEDGKAAGSAAELPPPPETELTGVTDTLVPGTPYVTSGPDDQFRCFLLEPDFPEPIKWMTGLQVRPGNPDVVHHAVLAVMQPGAELNALKAAVGVGRAFECTNPATATGSYLLGVWTPGNQPMQTDDNLAVPILRGSAVVMQIHYHPAGQVNDADATSVDLRLGDTWPEKLYTYAAWGNAFMAPQLLPDPDDRFGVEFRIPANSDDHGEHMRFTVGAGEGGEPLEVPLFAAYPHMHYIGIGLQVRIERAAPQSGEPANECLVNVPRWNFDWQRAYQYDASFANLPTVRTGDTIDVQCTYDNTLENPFVQRALDDAGLDQPIDIYLGEETLDEMCLGIFGMVFDAPPPQSSVAMPRVPASFATPMGLGMMGPTASD